jgi:hypothetical protein
VASASLQASSDHIYALVATPETARKGNIVQLRPLSGAIEGNGALADPDKTTPNLLDIIPPPPLYPPPKHVKVTQDSVNLRQSTPDVSDLYSKVNKIKNVGSGTNSTKRKRLRKHSSAGNNKNNCDNGSGLTRSASAAVDWKSLDDADSSASESDNIVAGVGTVGGTDLGGGGRAAGEIRPDVVQQCRENGGAGNTAAGTSVLAAAEKK